MLEFLLYIAFGFFGFIAAVVMAAALCAGWFAASAEGEA